MDSKSNNKEIISSNKTNKIIDEISELRFTRYQLDLEDSVKGYDFVFDSIDGKHCKCNSNGIRTYNHLVCKETLNHLVKMAKWLSCLVRTYLQEDDMTITHNQMHHSDKYSQHCSIIWPVWLNGWVIFYELVVVSSNPVLSLKLHILCLFQARSSLMLRQLKSIDSL